LAMMTKDLARTVSFPPVEATATLKLIMNWCGSDFSLNLGSVIGL
jgi:hypothetical protein